MVTFAIVVAFMVLFMVAVAAGGARGQIQRLRREADQPDGTSELLRRPLRSRYPS